MLSVAVHCISCLYRNSSPGLSLVVTEVYDFAVQSDSDAAQSGFRKNAKNFIGAALCRFGGFFLVAGRMELLKQAH